MRVDVRLFVVMLVLILLVVVVAMSQVIVDVLVGMPVGAMFPRSFAWPALMVMGHVIVIM